LLDLYADKTELTVRQRETVTSGSVNVYRARFEFSEDWEGLSRTAVFQAGAESRAVRLDETLECTVPWEVLRKPNVLLEVGVYGTRNDETVLPTVWASLGVIHEGAAPREEARPHTPGLWEQELARKGDGLRYEEETLFLLSGETVLSSVELPGRAGEKGDPGPQDPPGAVEVGVITFNGRGGAVMPQAGDYTAEMVGAATMEQVAAAISAAVTGAIGEVY